MLGFLEDQFYLLETIEQTGTQHARKHDRKIRNYEELMEELVEAYLNSLPKKKISSMRSFTPDMDHHVTLQAK